MRITVLPFRQHRRRDGSSAGGEKIAKKFGEKFRERLIFGKKL
jgi:hypothetical protein